MLLEVFVLLMPLEVIVVLAFEVLMVLVPLECTWRQCGITPQTRW